MTATRWILVCEPDGASARQVFAAIDDDRELVTIAIGSRARVEATLTGALADGATHCIGLVEDIATDAELLARRIAAVIADFPPCPVLIAANATDDELAPLLAAQLGYAQLTWVVGVRVCNDEITALRAPGDTWFRIPQRTVLSVVPGSPPREIVRTPSGGDITWRNAEELGAPGATPRPRPIASPCEPRRALRCDSAEELVAKLDRHHPALRNPGKPR